MMAPLPAGLRILLADDKPINTKMLALRLSKLLVDPKFTFAVTGEGALELLSTQVAHTPTGRVPPPCCPRLAGRAP
jgi:CheY-like chemotaxis protein